MNAAARVAHGAARPAGIVRPLLAGAAFAFAAGLLVLLAYLDVLTSRSYEWVIGGPPPFDTFGSGPFMLWFHVAFGVAAIGFVASGVALLRESEDC